MHPTQPVDGAVISSTVTIEGVADQDGLAYYELAYRRATGDFKRFDGGFKPVKTPSTLGEFKTAGLLNRVYTIRL